MTFVVKLLITMEAIPRVSRCFTRQWRERPHVQCVCPFSESRKEQGQQQSSPEGTYLVGALLYDS